ncbi:hypothetical protein LCM20_16685 [Halobacillus litoralis]|uniref:hypothetical protein n=1 Tax=Halobacillus litoralis TaxID=45668 RepID=UPI001CD5B7FC|nr:hypothetical protein [Halobacillus litoralis]MCA0972247.1 hypothetical protein [Halobacillus litoralis]
MCVEEAEMNGFKKSLRKYTELHIAMRAVILLCIFIPLAYVLNFFALIPVGVFIYYYSSLLTKLSSVLFLIGMAVMVFTERSPVFLILLSICLVLVRVGLAFASSNNHSIFNQQFIKRFIELNENHYQKDDCKRLVSNLLQGKEEKVRRFLEYNKYKPESLLNEEDNITTLDFAIYKDNSVVVHYLASCVDKDHYLRKSIDYGSVNTTEAFVLEGAEWKGDDFEDWFDLENQAFVRSIRCKSKTPYTLQQLHAIMKHAVKEDDRIALERVLNSIKENFSVNIDTYIMEVLDDARPDTLHKVLKEMKPEFTDAYNQFIGERFNNYSNEKKIKILGFFNVSLFDDLSDNKLIQLLLDEKNDKVLNELGRKEFERTYRGDFSYDNWERDYLLLNLISSGDWTYEKLYSILESDLLDKDQEVSAIVKISMDLYDLKFSEETSNIQKQPTERYTIDEIVDEMKINDSGRSFATAVEQIECSTCKVKGTVKCREPYCDTGKVRCTTCIDGKVACRNCRGTGEEESICTECSDGKVRCNCQTEKVIDSKKEYCRKCKGDGCGECSDNGWTSAWKKVQEPFGGIVREIEYEYNHELEKFKKIECSDILVDCREGCDNGYLYCAGCQGNQYVRETCSECIGETRVKCPEECEVGFFNCSSCEGTGFIMCGDCNGKRHVYEVTKTNATPVVRETLEKVFSEHWIEDEDFILRDEEPLETLQGRIESDRELYWINDEIDKLLTTHTHDVGEDFRYLDSCIDIDLYEVREIIIGENQYTFVNGKLKNIYTVQT